MADQENIRDGAPATGQSQPASDDSLDTLLDEGPKALAKKRRVSVRTLRRQFVRAGTTLSSYLLGVRRRGVASLLRHPELSLAEVARRLGFSSSNVLVRFVRREFGATPGALRQKLQDPAPSPAVPEKAAGDVKSPSSPSKGTP